MYFFSIQRCSVHIRTCFVLDIADTPATAVTSSNDAGPDPMSGHVTAVQDRISDSGSTSTQTSVTIKKRNLQVGSEDYL